MEPPQPPDVTQETKHRLGRVGVWSTQFRTVQPSEAAAAAAEAEQVGYGAAWVPGRQGGDVLGVVRALLRSTDQMVVATGVINIWMHDPSMLASQASTFRSDERGRFLLGLGVSHVEHLTRVGIEPGRPVRAMRSYLDRIDEGPLASSPRMLGALGPRMVELAARRTSGVHPYLLTPTQIASMREELGEGSLIAPALHVVRSADRQDARRMGREVLAHSLELSNYRAAFKRGGFTDADLDGGGSDRLVDGLIAWGTDGAIARRVREHIDAGADHVCVHLIGRRSRTLPRSDWSQLAGALIP